MSSRKGVSGHHQGHHPLDCRCLRQKKRECSVRRQWLFRVAEEGEHDGIEGDNIDVVFEAFNLPSKSLDNDGDSDSAIESDMEEEC